MRKPCSLLIYACLCVALLMPTLGRADTDDAVALATDLPQSEVAFAQEGRDLDQQDNSDTATSSSVESPPPSEDFPSAELVNGWTFLAAQLIRQGVPREDVISVLGDDRMPQRTPVTFKLKPRETEQQYSIFTRPVRLAIARDCLTANHTSFVNAEQQFKVSRYALAALLLIETQCGQFLGTSSVLERLARVSSVSEPQNIDFNFKQLRDADPTVTREAVAARAQYLEDTFLPEVKALFTVAQIKKVDMFHLRGSVAGAFGLPQFLPSSYLRYAVDASGDGFADLFDPKDAIPSIANYLHSFGWHDDSTVEEKKKVLWHYNRSDAYGDAVLKVSILLKQPTPQDTQVKSTPAQRSVSKRSSAPTIKDSAPHR